MTSLGHTFAKASVFNGNLNGARRPQLRSERLSRGGSARLVVGQMDRPDARFAREPSNRAATPPDDSRSEPRFYQQLQHACVVGRPVGRVGLVGRHVRGAAWQNVPQLEPMNPNMHEMAL